MFVVNIIFTLPNGSLSCCSSNLNIGMVESIVLHNDNFFADYLPHLLIIRFITLQVSRKIRQIEPLWRNPLSYFSI